jgi:hypothetical protein
MGNAESSDGRTSCNIFGDSGGASKSVLGALRFSSDGRQKLPQSGQPVAPGLSQHLQSLAQQSEEKARADAAARKERVQKEKALHHQQQQLESPSSDGNADPAQASTEAKPKVKKDPDANKFVARFRGALSKQGAQHMNWKLRHCIVGFDSFFYFDTEKEGSTFIKAAPRLVADISDELKQTALGWFPLRNAQMHVVSDSQFTVTPALGAESSPDDRTYYFVVPEDQVTLGFQASQWIGHIRDGSRGLPMRPEEADKPTFSIFDQVRLHGVTALNNKPTVTAPTFTRFNVRYEGWLQKEGGIVKSWKTRWAVCGQDAIYYFETKEIAAEFIAASPTKLANVSDSLKDKTLGIVPLKGGAQYRTSPDGPRSFEVFSQKADRTWKFELPEDAAANEVEKWATAIRQAISS